ncbi:MAG: hypothetical protein ACTSYA_13525 [Candidatus Kariarchaeaceae archaeon]
MTSESTSLEKKLLLKGIWDKEPHIFCKLTEKEVILESIIVLKLEEEEVEEEKWGYRKKEAQENFLYSRLTQLVENDPNITVRRSYYEGKTHQNGVNKTGKTNQTRKNEVVKEEEKYRVLMIVSVHIKQKYSTETGSTKIDSNSYVNHFKDYLKTISLGIKGIGDPRHLKGNMLELVLETKHIPRNTGKILGIKKGIQGLFQEMGKVLTDDQLSDNFQVSQGVSMHKKIQFDPGPFAGRSKEMAKIVIGNHSTFGKMGLSEMKSLLFAGEEKTNQKVLFSILNQINTPTIVLTSTQTDYSLPTSNEEWSILGFNKVEVGKEMTINMFPEEAAVDFRAVSWQGRILKKVFSRERDFDSKFATAFFALSEGSPFEKRTELSLGAFRKALFDPAGVLLQDRIRMDIGGVLALLGNSAVLEQDSWGHSECNDPFTALQDGRWIVNYPNEDPSCRRVFVLSFLVRLALLRETMDNPPPLVIIIPQMEDYFSHDYRQRNELNEIIPWIERENIKLVFLTEDISIVDDTSANFLKNRIISRVRTNKARKNLAVAHNLTQEQEQYLGDLAEDEYLFVREDASQNPLYLKLDNQKIQAKEMNRNYYVPDSTPKESIGQSQEAIEILKIINARPVKGFPLSTLEIIATDTGIESFSREIEKLFDEGLILKKSTTSNFPGEPLELIRLSPRGVELLDELIIQEIHAKQKENAKNQLVSESSISKNEPKEVRKAKEEKGKNKEDKQERKEDQGIMPEYNFDEMPIGKIAELMEDMVNQCNIELGRQNKSKAVQLLKQIGYIGLDVWKKKGIEEDHNSLNYLKTVTEITEESKDSELEMLIDQVSYAALNIIQKIIVLKQENDDTEPKEQENEPLPPDIFDEEKTVELKQVEKNDHKSVNIETEKMVRRTKETSSEKISVRKNQLNKIAELNEDDLLNSFSRVTGNWTKVEESDLPATENKELKKEKVAKSERSEEPKEPSDQSNNQKINQNEQAYFWTNHGPIFSPAPDTNYQENKNINSNTFLSIVASDPPVIWSKKKNIKYFDEVSEEAEEAIETEKQKKVVSIPLAPSEKLDPLDTDAFPSFFKELMKELPIDTDLFQEKIKKAAVETISAKMNKYISLPLNDYYDVVKDFFDETYNKGDNPFNWSYSSDPNNQKQIVRWMASKMKQLNFTQEKLEELIFLLKERRMKKERVKSPTLNSTKKIPVKVKKAKRKLVEG